MEAGENSPCSVAWWWNREKILPAREKWPDFGVFGRAGRVLYRLGQGVGVAGRVLYRLSPGVAVAGRVLYRVSGGLVLEAGENSPCSREMAGFRCFWACWESFVPGEWWIGVGSGRKFSLLGCVVVEAGENSPCSREMAGFRCFWACWESFVPVGPGGGCCWESFVPVEPGGGCCWESFVPGEWWVGGGSGRKFSLLGGVVVEPGENSPCALEMAGFWCFWACGESFVPVGPGDGCCGESFVPVGP